MGPPMQQLQPSVLPHACLSVGTAWLGGSAPSAAVHDAWAVVTRRKVEESQNSLAGRKPMAHPSSNTPGLGRDIPTRPGCPRPPIWP